MTLKDNINKVFQSNLFCVFVYASWLFPKVLYFALNFDHCDEYLKAIKKRKKLVPSHVCTKSLVLFNYLKV